MLAYPKDLNNVYFLIILFVLKLNLYFFNVFWFLLSFFLFFFIKCCVVSNDTIYNESFNDVFLIKFLSLSFFKNISVSRIYLYKFFLKFINWCNFLLQTPLKFLFAKLISIDLFILWRPLFKKWSYFGLFSNTRSKFNNL